MVHRQIRRSCSTELQRSRRRSPNASGPADSSPVLPRELSKSTSLAPEAPSRGLRSESPAAATSERGRARRALGRPFSHAFAYAPGGLSFKEQRWTSALESSVEGTPIADEDLTAGQRGRVLCHGIRPSRRRDDRSKSSP